MGPPPAMCENSATKVATSAAAEPRANRLRTSEVLSRISVIVACPPGGAQAVRHANSPRSLGGRGEAGTCRPDSPPGCRLARTRGSGPTRGSACTGAS
ncbi:hypothetical protein GCM10009823_20710 [Brevibacterium salitolerans]|uniref:Uncharacterized protein n=1 Tax=Brevibacterium salitolerans TaxID=1403566 RepID=A0ABN2WWZ7_9MICO